MIVDRNGLYEGLPVVKWKQLLSFQRSRVPVWLGACLARHTDLIEGGRGNVDALDPESLSFATCHLTLDRFPDIGFLEIKLFGE